MFFSFIKLNAAEYYNDEAGGARLLLVRESERAA
jgi:hypothetical protein